MTSQIIRGAEVNRPVPDPITSSILDHATVKDVASFGLRNNEGLWPSYNLLQSGPTDICATEDTPTKVFSFGDWIEAREFALYSGVQCKAVGLDEVDMTAENRRVFLANEGKGIEKWAENNLLNSGIDLTPAGGAPSLAAAFAILEGRASSMYAGQPTIWMSRAAASLLGADKVVFDASGKAFSRIGSKIALGGGIAIPSDATWTMYATGEVYIERSETVDQFAYVLPGDGSGIGSGENGLEDNTVISLVERMYRVAAEDFIPDSDADTTGVLRIDGRAWSA